MYGGGGRHSNRNRCRYREDVSVTLRRGERLPNSVYTG